MNSTASPVREKVVLYAKGLAMGVADIIPGVSGGTIAFISGIYERLIAAIDSAKPRHALSMLELLVFFANKDRRQRALQSLASIHWGFLLPLMAGIVTAILLMAKIIPGLMLAYPYHMYALFFGLILFSIPVVFREMKRDISSFVVLLVFAAAMFLLMGDTGQLVGSTSLPYVFISGAIAICAMILPGISGSYILVLLGQYLIVLDALHRKDLAIIAVFISGILVGILSFVRILKFLLARHHSLTMAGLTGIMIGSLRTIWPGKHIPESGISTTSLVVGMLLLVAGGMLVHLLNRIGKDIPPKGQVVA